MNIKLMLATGAAVLMAPVAFAQTAAPAGEPATTAPGTTSTTTTTDTMATTPAADPMASSTTSSTTTTTASAAPNGVMKDGTQYMKDGRKATRAETAEYKKWAKDNGQPQ